MFLINAESIGVAHLEAVKKVTNFGVPDITEDNEHVVKLEAPLCIHVSNPLHNYNKFVNSPYGSNFDREYELKISEITPRKNDGLDPTYTYGNRFRDYLRPVISHDPQRINLYGDGDMHSSIRGYDQLSRCIEELRLHPSTRRAVMCTWIPWNDHESPEPPCIMVVDFKITHDSRLTLVAFIRSNDILMAWGENAIGLVSLQSRVADALNLHVGYLETISRDAHIYYKRDQTDLRNMGVIYDV